MKAFWRGFEKAATDAVPAATVTPPTASRVGAAAANPAPIPPSGDGGIADIPGDMG